MLIIWKTCRCIKKAKFSNLQKKNCSIGSPIPWIILIEVFYCIGYVFHNNFACGHRESDDLWVNWEACIMISENKVLATCRINLRCRLALVILNCNFPHNRARIRKQVLSQKTLTAQRYSNSLLVKFQVFHLRSTIDDLQSPWGKRTNLAEPVRKRITQTFS